MTTTTLSQTNSLCGVCKRGVAATVVRVDDRVVMNKVCADHGPQEVLLSPNADWYERVLAYDVDKQTPHALKEATSGCPFDCGPCTEHQQRVHLPIVPITSACNLDCPICYTHNNNDATYHMAESELEQILGHLERAAPDKRIINLTGGEPTLHPQFERLIRKCHERGVHRITVSTHGLGLPKNPALLDVLAELDARVILSFDSFEDEVNKKMLGGTFTSGKMAALDALENADVNTTLLPVLGRGENDHELGAFINLALDRKNIRSIELHTMTFTGQGGASYDRSSRYTTYDVLMDIERQTDGMFCVDDFVPSTVAHPTCYLVTYALAVENRWVPFPRFMSPEDLRALLAGGLYLEPSADVEERLGDVINRLWSEQTVCEDAEAILAALKKMMRGIFSPDLSAKERMQVAERSTKAIYVHAHMDEENFDTERVRLCPVGIREPDGTNIPSCAYNVIYRERDPRFVTTVANELVTLGRGGFLAGLKPFVQPTYPGQDSQTSEE